MLRIITTCIKTQKDMILTFNPKISRKISELLFKADRKMNKIPAKREKPKIKTLRIEILTPTIRILRIRQA